MLRFSLAALALSVAALAQSAAPLSFEVASIKPAVRPEGRPIGNRALADRIDYQYATLRQCIAFAYSAKDYQISGPAWLADDHWAIQAKGPQGTTREQLPEMMRTLLAERFHLQAHRDPREFDGLAIVVGKNGPKLKSSAPGSPLSFQMRFSFSGGGKLESPSLSMTGLANMIAGWLGRPVNDETGLAGNFEISLEYAPGERKDLTPPPMTGPPPANPEPEVSVFTSIQSLGLKLEPRKVALDMIVVDHAEKKPTDN